MTDTPAPSDEYVQSLARGLSVITAFDAERPEMGLSEVAAQTGLSRATARRFLHTLVALGFMRTDGRTYSLTPQVLRLGTAYLSGLGLPQAAEPHLQDLSSRLNESTSMAVLDGAEIVYVARAATRRIMSVGITVGTRFPAYATSMGRVLLADLSGETLAEHISQTTLSPLTDRTEITPGGLDRILAQTRLQGYALVDQELERGLRSLAVPVILDGRWVAAINVSTSAADYDAPAQLIDALLPPLLDTASLIAADLSAINMTAPKVQRP